MDAASTALSHDCTASIACKIAATPLQLLQVTGCRSQPERTHMYETNSVAPVPTTRWPEPKRWAPRLAAPAAMFLAILALGATTARAAEPEPARSEGAGENTAPSAETREQQPSLPSGQQGPDPSTSPEQEPLAQNRLLASRLQGYASFLEEVTRLVRADNSDFAQVLAKVRLLSQLNTELEQASQNYAAPLAGSPPRTPQLLLEELVRLRSGLAEREQELDQVRSRLAEREQALAKAMPEIARVLDYQRELKRLRAEVLRSGVRQARSNALAESTPAAPRATAASR
jgi:hypothetical protein